MDHLRLINSMKFEIESLAMGNMNSTFAILARLLICNYLIMSIKSRLPSYNLLFLDFESWKSNIECFNKCSYVFKSHVLKSNDQRSRLLKSAGSCKMSSACTSEIKVMKENNKVVVQWQKVHYGHKVEIQHIRLPQREKQDVAPKIINGVVSQRILEYTRDDIGAHLKRIDLLTLKDIQKQLWS
ncbi:uncharacterized protein LOC125505788 isoform X2 [Dendroctonus ponderosae]|uniref:uncharacterized protein LOC125505788 isoform X2 n=1 Tax=Dendroctonus ponderosae TaxID=77166 RepID=UPI0020364807|nr:uncharacterized protein LOC125505788 isoform X2 [Dendroctonus ponderosae]